MPRRVDPEERALRILRKLASGGNADAAAQLALAERRRKREDRTQAKRDAEEAQKAAKKVSRSTVVKGPGLAPGMTERTLAWLLDDDPDPAEAAAIDAAHKQLILEQAAEPEHLDRSPGEIARQEAADAQMRDAAAWFRRGCALRDAGDPEPFRHDNQED